MLLLIILLCLMITPSWVLSDPTRSNLVKSFAIQRSPAANRLKVGGNLDETRFLWPNKPANKRFFSRIRVINEGGYDVINPRLRINGFRIPLSSDELLEGLTQNSQDPLDRVLRAFYGMSYYGVHAVPQINTHDSLFYFLYHPFGQCDYQSAVQANLWERFGYRWRVSGPHNHTSAEVEVSGKTIHLDTDLDAFYLMYDNKTIASAQDIHNDPMLVIRSSHHRVHDRFPRSPQDPEIDMYFSSEKYAALYNGTRVSAPPLQRGTPVTESVRIVLRPGESYSWHTAKPEIIPLLDDDPYIIPVIRNVLWETHLDLANKSHRWFLHDERKRSQNTGAVDFNGRTITIPYQLPFPTLGMNIHLIPSPAVDMDGLDPDEKVRIRMVARGKTMEADVALREIFKGEYSFDHLVKEMPFPLKEFRIEIEGSRFLSDKRKVFPLSGIRINLNCLSSIFALRAVRSGVNTLEYSDESAKRSVRIIVEAAQEQINLPHLPSDRFYPSENAEIPGSKLRFAWPEAAGDGAAGYHFQISAFPDMRYPLSPTFDRLVKEDQMSISEEVVTFRLPWHGMLPVQKQLYWRVRPFNKDLLTGDWSKPIPFRVRGPGAPEQVKLTERDGKVILSWKAAAYGTAPARYEIHASDLEGFIPVDKPHRILGLSEHNTTRMCWHDTCATAWPVVSSTFFTSTRETNIVLIPSDVKNLKRRLGAHWRVIAIDAEESRSAPSPQGFLRTPMLVPPETVVIPPGKVTYRVPFVSTLGRVWIKENYDMGLWSKPQITFSLKPNPAQKAAYWKIDPKKGIVTGQLGEKEQISLAVFIQDQYGRSDTRAIKFRAKAK